MQINENELAKLCRYAYNLLSDCKEIVINDIKVKISRDIHLELRLNYYGVTTLIRAIAEVKIIADKIMVDIEGGIKYGFINFDLKTIIKEFIKDMAAVDFVDEMILIDNNYLAGIKLKEGYVEIELK